MNTRSAAILTVLFIAACVVIVMACMNSRKKRLLSKYYHFVNTLNTTKGYDVHLKCPQLCRDILQHSANTEHRQAGRGLQLDVDVLSYFLKDQGVEIYTSYLVTKHSVLHLEHIHIGLLNKYKTLKHIFIPNHELMETRDRRLLPKMDRIFVKTDTCDEMIKNIDPTLQRVRISLLTPIVFSSHVVRKTADLVIHPAGKSWMKNTKAVLDTWKKYGSDLPPLIITCSHMCLATNPATWFGGLPDNVCMVDALDELAMDEMWSRASICLMPSACEGFGHVIHTAYAYGCICITTDANPMNVYSEYMPIHTVPPIPQSRYKAFHTSVESMCYDVDPNDIKTVMHNVVYGMSLDQKQQLGQMSHSSWRKLCADSAESLEHALVES